MNQPMPAAGRNRLAGIVFLCLSAPYVGGCKAEPTPTARAATADSVRGTWRVVPFDSGADTARFGRAPTGYLVYDGTGHVFWQVLRQSAMDSLQLGTQRSAPDSTLLRLVSGFNAQFGTYTVDGSKRLVVHHYEGEMPPRRGNAEVATPFRLHGDSLFLGADSSKAWRFVRVR